MRQELTTSFETQLEAMVMRVVMNELCQTQEMPVMVDLMEQHEVILSRVEGLGRPTKLGEFDVAFTEWAQVHHPSLRTTQTVPAVELDDLLASMGGF